MQRKTLVVAGLMASLMATGAWASADYCLHVVSANNVSGRALKNTCNETVEATWCYGSGCRYNNSWTVHPGQEMPLESASSTDAYVRYDACRGANSIKSTNPFSCR